MATKVSSARFVGRTAEFDLLTSALSDARSGRPSLVLLGGEAGVGKTRLVDEFTQRSRAEGVRVLVGGNVELGEEGMPFAPVSAALRGLLRDLTPEQTTALLEPGREDLARLLPELGPVGTRTEAGRGRLFEVLIGLLERLAQESPLLLIVEDLHWADRSTRELLAYLARSLRDSQILIVVTYRSDEVHRGHPLRAYLAELDRVGTVVRRQLERLTHDEVAAQVADLLGAPPAPWVVQRVYDRSEGNAFFVEEIVCADLHEDDGRLTDSLRELLLARLERLPQRTQWLLRIASVGGRHVDYGLLSAVSEMPENDLAEALREAVFGHALTVDADETSFSFRHSLVREALHEDLLPGEHGRVHARYAEALERDPTLVPPARFSAEIAH
ncbi:MAG: AAA family ATPase, partial [Mycobacteriales bacterium]